MPVRPLAITVETVKDEHDHSHDHEDHAGHDHTHTSEYAHHDDGGVKQHTD